MSMLTTLALVAASTGPAPPQGTVGARPPASSGQTELEGAGQFGTAAAVVEGAEEETDATELLISAGGLLSTGNARALALTSLARFRLRRKIHEFRSDMAGNYSQAAIDRDADLEPTVGNVQGRVRYDVFFAKRWSAFGMVTARHDPFQGLRLRLNVDPGVAFYALTKKNHRLWFETGYDYQFDVRTRDAIIAKDDAGNPLRDADGNTIQVEDDVLHGHAVRLFGGYSNHLSEQVTFDTGLEYLQSVLVARRWRLNWDVALTTALGKRFAFATTFTMRIDNDPLPDIRKVDTITAFNLVVNLI
jgi:putative salt-induced outer membrane protein YdiY